MSYNPALTVGSRFAFQVASGTNSLEVKITTTSLLGQTGNPTNLILIEPDGVTQYRSGTPLTSTLSGTWTLKVDGLRGVALPETVASELVLRSVAGATNLGDMAGHPAEAASKLGYSVVR